MRKALKFLHTVAAAGLIGGVAAHAILLAAAPADSPAAYADLRQAIAAIGNWLLLPSLAVALVTGLFAMAWHRPFIDKGWAWLKAALGILMFKAVTEIVGAKANHAAVVSRRIADGEAEAAVLEAAIASEWAALAAIAALSLANVALGIWRPRLSRPRSARGVPVRAAPGTAESAARDAA